MIQLYLKAAKLRGWLCRPQCPPAIHKCKILLDRAYRNFDQYYDLDGEAKDLDNVQIPATTILTPVSQDLYALILECTAVLRAYLRHEGVMYSQSSTHISNSLILFYPQGDCALSSVPGSIKYIFGGHGSLAFC